MVGWVRRVRWGWRSTAIRGGVLERWCDGGDVGGVGGRVWVGVDPTPDSSSSHLNQHLVTTNTKSTKGSWISLDLFPCFIRTF